MTYLGVMFKRKGEVGVVSSIGHKFLYISADYLKDPGPLHVKKRILPAPGTLASLVIVWGGQAIL